ncbi:MAG: thiamine pyrophosphate-dependent enzyme [Nitrospinae bacterium]|jgi:sulfopyruvate decarboxylase subunit beta|nr:thiamine pyrophosphate-dependent enzyme [Nitrospinota bacterium]MDA1109491.1 thiamine pyrophosphate-dependent enzyme [Nitrospinota bacterium]
MKGTEAFEVILPLVKDAPIVHANGYICRESFKNQDREGNFYMIGSMGLASSIGLGVALCRPDKKVIIFDGDGNVLMSMGTLAMIAATAPKNLVHVVFDNQVYESTGSQRSLSESVPLEEVARSCGYPVALKVTEKEDLKPAFEKLMAGDGPSFLLIKVDPDFDPATGRVTHTPEEIKARFMKSMN